MSTPAPLPPGVVAFLDAHIFSVSQLEVLLLVREAAGEVRTADDLSRETHLPAASIRQWLDGFVAVALLQRSDGGYRYDCGGGGEPVVSEVAECYARRRVSLTRYVYTLGDPARRFADAFKFRRDKDS